MDLLSTSNNANPHFYLGLCLAISSSLFIGTSFIIKKVSLRKLNNKGGLRAGAGGYGYLKDWMWWLGFGTMGVGELANFAAFTFAPASLVTALGALSILIASILASKYLDERLAPLGKIGCFLCIIGSTLIIVYAPKEEELKSLNDFVEKTQDSVFVYYVLGLTVFMFLLIFHFSPKYGTKKIIIYVALCSSIGSFTVVACKALGLAIRTFFEGKLSSRDLGTTFILLLIVITCIVLQMNYLNKSLDLFDTNLVTPLYYVMFNFFVIVISSILFKEWSNIKFANALGASVGGIITVIAIFLISNFKETSHLPLVRSLDCQSGENVYYARDV